MPAETPESVLEKIADGNAWYTADQVEHALDPAITRLYAGRFAFFAGCIERARARLGRPVLRILDAGCGDGYWLSRLQSIPGLQLTGLDYNPLRVARARQLVPGASILQGELAALPPGGEPFDVVLLSQVIEHVPDDEGLLRDIRARLRPQGTLILGTPNEGSLLQRWRVPADSDHCHFYTEPVITARIADAGFAIDSVMREVFYPGLDRVYYGMTRHAPTFRLLELLTRLFPSQCSDYYFECHWTG